MVSDSQYELDKMVTQAKTLEMKIVLFTKNMLREELGREPTEEELVRKLPLFICTEK